MIAARQATFAEFPIEIIQVPAQTPKKLKKTVGKKQAAEKESIEENPFDCTKNAGMKCRCCIHTDGKSTWFPTCPRTLRIGEDHPKNQDAYGKAPTRELDDDVKKYSCKYWERCVDESCKNCGHHEHTFVLKQSCPVLTDGETRDGEVAEEIQMNSRKIRCSSWISNAESMHRAAKAFKERP